MSTLRKLKREWIKARIAYHRRQADSYGRPVVRSYRRDRYHVWLRNMALRHMMKAHALERQLTIASREL
jgi:ribosomal protein S21